MTVGATATPGAGAATGACPGAGAGAPGILLMVGNRDLIQIETESAINNYWAEPLVVVEPLGNRRRRVKVLRVQLEQNLLEQPSQDYRSSCAKTLGLD